MQTTTFDNTKGFADHMMVADALQINSYFTGLYASQNKETIKIRIGQVRRFF